VGFPFRRHTKSLIRRRALMEAGGVHNMLREASAACRDQ
jgi:hypothetical protein